MMKFDGKFLIVLATHKSFLVVGIEQFNLLVNLKKLKLHILLFSK